MKKLRSYLLENEKELALVVSELNAYNGSLDYMDFWSNDAYTINDIFPSAYEFAERIQYGDYNINDDYFKIDVHGNIVSYSEYDMIQEMKDDIEIVIEMLLDYYHNIYIDTELKELIENALNEEEEGEE